MGKPSIDHTNPYDERQKKALLRMLREGPEGFKGGFSAGKYAGITGASPATTTRDLADLVAKHALVRSGEQRHTRYAIAIPLRPVQPVAIDEQGNLSRLPKNSNSGASMITTGQKTRENFCSVLDNHRE